MKTIEELLASKGIIPERPPSIDEKGRRLDIFPAKVKGKYRTLRSYVYLFLLFIFLVLPWTKFAGQQTIFLNLKDRKFIFFGSTFFAHDGPYLFLVLGIFLLALALLTVLYGRVWCGWACPQTVFIDTLYRKVEEWIEGNHIQRKKLASQAWTKSKLIKKTFKWALFLIISSHITHSFFAYFVGARELVWITLDSPAEHWKLFVAVQIITLLTLINFGWFKEQFCLIACPYGRFQSVFMDTKSLSVYYDDKRGEPRRQKGVEEFADCVNCYKCVAVCPTGIDIRDGMQLECIACTACIDACDEVMEKVGKPKGLIRYASEEEIQNGQKPEKKINIRSVAYSGFLVVLVGVFILLIFLRPDVSVKVLRAVGAPYEMIYDNGISYSMNHFKIHITNQTNESIQNLEFSTSNKNLKLVAPTSGVEVASGENKWIHVFVKAPIEEFKNSVLETDIVTDWTLSYELKDKTFKNKGSFRLLAPSK